MPLTLHSEFKEMDIEDVQVLRSGTVYKVTGFAGDVLVLKSEAGNVGAASLNHAKTAMKAVDRGAGKVKALSNPEVAALRAWAEFLKRVTKDFADNMVNNFESGPGAKDLYENLTRNPHALWYKMPLADLTDADSLLNDRLGVNKDKSVMNLFKDGLLADGGIEQIGRIITADMYIGNNDRFNPHEGSQKQYGGKDLSFKVIKNVGNIFIIGKKTEQKIAFSGHDFLDPNSGYKNYETSLDEVKDSYGEEWLGDTLCDKKARHKFAENVVDDLETILTPNRKRFSPFRKLGSKAVKRLEQGFLTGMQDITEELARKYKDSQMPVGVKQRYERYRQALQTW